MTHPDECEQVPELTHAVNVKGTELLVEALPQGVPLIYISTDLVFDGVQGNYSERDEANPLNTYARSKLEAEQSVLRRAGSVVVPDGQDLQPRKPLSHLFRLLAAHPLAKPGEGPPFQGPVPNTDLRRRCGPGFRRGRQPRSLL